MKNTTTERWLLFHDDSPATMGPHFKETVDLYTLPHEENFK